MNNPMQHLTSWIDENGVEKHAGPAGADSLERHGSALLQDLRGEPHPARISLVMGRAADEIERLRHAIENEIAENRKLQRGAVLYDFEAFAVAQARRLQEALSQNTPVQTPGN